MREPRIETISAATRAAIGVFFTTRDNSTSVRFCKVRVDAEGDGGAQGGPPRADPRGRPARVRAARLRGRDGRAARGGDRSLPRRDLQLLREQGGALRRARRGARPTGSSRSGSSRATARCSRRSRTRMRTGSPSRSRRRAGSARTSGSGSRSRGSSRRRESAARVAVRRGCGASTRDDVPIEVIAQFLGMLANGVAFARVTDDPMPDLDQLMTLIETGVAPR